MSAPLKLTNPCYHNSSWLSTWDDIECETALDHDPQQKQGRQLQARIDDAMGTDVDRQIRQDDVERSDHDDVHRVTVE